jgi:LacI family transcriptional regulator
MTVSNVVNGKFSSMSVDTRKKVQRIVAELGYRPLISARGLRLSRSFSVGMIVADESDHFLADPFTGHLVAGLSNTLSNAWIGTLVHRTDPMDHRQSYMTQCLQTDAVCVLTAGTKAARLEMLRDLMPLRIPTIVFQEASLTDDFAVTRIVMDDRHGAAQIGALVAKAGVRKAIILTKSNTRPALEERERGFIEGLRKGRADVDVQIIGCGQGTLPEISEQIESQFDKPNPAQALLGCNDQMALFAIQVLARRGVRVPEDVMVSGFNGFELSQVTSQRLTTFRAPAYDMGEIAARLLLQHFDNGAALPRLITARGKLILGETTVRNRADCREARHSRR